MNNRTLYRFVYKGDLKLNRYAQMLIENGMLVWVTEPLLTREEAANDPEVIKSLLDRIFVSEDAKASFLARLLEVTDDE